MDKNIRNQPIDIVVTWVDDTDPVWREKREEHTGYVCGNNNTDARYRDWDTLRYWFRGVEKYAPWVRYVFFVTDDQKPEWLDINHPKLKWIKHTDYIPAEYLPTFSSNVIELNLHRIEGLSESFVYLNDDVFFVSPTRAEDFFVEGVPCDLPELGVLYSTGDFSHTLFNNAEVINRHFTLCDSIKQNRKKWMKNQGISGLLKLLWYGRKPYLSYSVGRHAEQCLTKRAYREIWESEVELLDSVSRNKIRTRADITSWLIRDWQLLSGNFVSKKPIGKMYFTASLSHSTEALDALGGSGVKIVCLNDGEGEREYEKHKKMIIDAFERAFSERSSYELF